MTRNRFVKAAVVIGSILTAAYCQDVIISNPSPWMTLRSDSVMVTVQADTSKLPKKSILFKVRQHNGTKLTTLFSKSVKMEDVSGDFFLGSLKGSTLGGSSLVSLEWSVPGTELKGVLGPVGMVKLSEQKPVLSAVKLKDGISADQVKDELSKSEMVKLGASSFQIGWNKEALFIAVNKDGSGAQLQFAFDGKCGKNAFLSWADRFVTYAADQDSVFGTHYKRDFDNTAIQYSEMKWGDGLLLHKSDSLRVIKVLWHEIGVLPFEERNIGIFCSETIGKASQVYPSGAQREIPGTWGDVKLEK